MTALVLLGERCMMETVTIADVPFLKVTLRNKGMGRKRQARRAAKKLRANGVRTAVFVKGFSYTDIFGECGIFPPSVNALRLAVAVPIICAALRERGASPEQAFIAVRAPRFGAEAEALVTALSSSVRYLSIEGEGSGELAGRLRFHRGVALREGTAGAQLILSLWEKDCCTEQVLALFDGSLRVFYDFDASVDGVETEMLLAAICAESEKKAEKVAVLGIDASNLLTIAENNSIMLCT